MKIFSFSECCWFLNRNFDDCMLTVGTDYVLKAINVDGVAILFRVSEKEGRLVAEILKGPKDEKAKKAVGEYTREWFDLDRDLTPFYDKLEKDRRLSYMTKDYHGLRLLSMPDLFEALCWSIIGQQINLPFAFRIKRRLVERYGEHLEYGGAVFHLFPTPLILAGAHIDELRAMQMTGRKAEYILNLARLFADGEMSKSLLAGLPDFSGRQKALTAIKGIGVWTANYALMKTMREPESIPHGDAGLINACIRHGVIKDKTDLTAMEGLFKRFTGWETYLVSYLWRSLAIRPAEVIIPAPTA